MIRSFKFSLPPASGVRLWLQALCGVLLLLNVVALYLYVAPPGGTRQQLTAEQQRLQNELVKSRLRVRQLKLLATKVQSGGTASADFENKYFLPRRRAYEAIVSEIQHLASVSGLHARDAVYSEEPIEGSADLSLMNSTANYEGTYENLLRFLREVDRSPLLLMLDSLQAAPQQKGGTINTSIRFQAIIRDDGTQKIGGQA
ncbi:MAG: hypothetical protein JO217_07070 [Acidobacteriaceae bacterium]|nr:hypothetical protein [Acidobacteriaceae bacterium]MBV9442440.1 hypothetical protein [Acidobacteriaceae bacterium]